MEELQKKQVSLPDGLREQDEKRDKKFKESEEGKSYEKKMGKFVMVVMLIDNNRIVGMWGEKVGMVQTINCIWYGDRREPSAPFIQAFYSRGTR